MERTITVKGTGKVSARPDYVVLTMHLQSRAMEYEKAMDGAALQIGQLQESLQTAGFEKASVKTTNFNVRTDYNNVQKPNGAYAREFNGFVCEHHLKAEFDFDSARLAQTLAAAAGCPARPELSVAFTVKDTDAVKEELLRAAAENARKKAELLCEASGVGLGKLVTINYNWSEAELYSPARYALAENCASAKSLMRSVDIEPDTIDVQDTASFVWEIE